MTLNSPVRIYTDSHYAYSGNIIMQTNCSEAYLGFTKWIHNWISKERSEGIKNFDLFYKAVSILKKSKYPFYIVN